MRRIALLPFAAALSLALALPAGAAPDKPAVPSDGKAAATPRPQTLDDLYGRLAASRSDTEAKGIATLIERRLSRSGSDTADLLMSRSAVALEGEDAALAIELLDRVTRMKPEWAEAWSRRAAAFYLLDDAADALADLHKALAAEPRLYNAWAALGHIEMASGNKVMALAAYKKALALHPYLDNIKEIVDRLSPDIDGRDL